MENWIFSPCENIKVQQKKVFDMKKCHKTEQYEEEEEQNCQN